MPPVRYPRTGLDFPPGSQAFLRASKIFRPKTGSQKKNPCQLCGVRQSWRAGKKSGFRFCWEKKCSKGGTPERGPRDKHDSLGRQKKKLTGDSFTFNLFQLSRRVGGGDVRPCTATKQGFLGPRACEWGEWDSEGGAISCSRLDPATSR